MIKIGITGSLASGKTTASKIISSGKGPLFSADLVVKKLYKLDKFKQIISRKFNINKNSNIKRIKKDKIISGEKSIKALEKILHPLVRREMKSFIKKNKHKKFLFFEIPLLIESKLVENFNLILFIKARKKVRLKRFRSRGGNVKLFKILNNKQLSDAKKAQFCDHVIVNEKNLKILKKKLTDIFKKYERNISGY